MFFNSRKGLPHPTVGSAHISDLSSKNEPSDTLRRQYHVSVNTVKTLLGVHARRVRTRHRQFHPEGPSRGAGWGTDPWVAPLQLRLSPQDHYPLLDCQHGKFGLGLRLFKSLGPFRGLLIDERSFMRAAHFTLAGYLVIATLAPVPNAASGAGPWGVKLAADSHHLELAYRGVTWVSGLRVEAISGSRKFASDTPEVKLTLVTGQGAGETRVKVEEKQSYELVFRTLDSSIAISLMGLPAKTLTTVSILADLKAGPEPLQAAWTGWRTMSSKW